MLQTTALAVLVLAIAGCAAPPPRWAVPPDTKRDLECVLGRLADEKNFDDVEAACLPGQEKRLVIILALLEVDRSLMADRPYIAIQSSLDLHEAQRRGLRTAHQERKQDETNKDTEVR